MEIQCDCGKFRAELTQFPKGTPGRLICYCKDCQALHYLKRDDLLDANAGTEIIPAYPADIKLVSGKEFMGCVRLSPTGMYRFFTTCCQTPIANTDQTRPWAGINHRMYTVYDPNKLINALGDVKSRVMGRDAKGKPPLGTPQKFDLKAMAMVLPFILKGLIFGKARPSPFFKNGEAIVATKVLSREERSKLSFC